MLDQKPIIHQIYRDLLNKKEWIMEYNKAPDAMLASYGISEANKLILKQILFLHS